MNFLKTPFQLGGVKLPNNIFYAPLAGCTDFPFRQMSAKYKPGLMYCEMVKMEALIRNDPGTFHILDYETSMHPIGAQLCGSKPEIAGMAAKMIEDLGFDVVDLNCGCPVDKVTKDGSGSGMLKTPHLIGKVISEMVAAVKIPVTVKIRAGWDEDHINAVEITKIAEEAGASAICIHARTRKQAYQGPARWEWIRACKEAAKEILIIGNGDLFSSRDVLRIYPETGCDAILVSRGMLGQPWIAEDIFLTLQGLPPKRRTQEDCRAALKEHFEHILEYHSERRGVIEMRRIGCWYLKNSAGTRSFREKMARVESLPEARELLDNFPLEGGSYPESECEAC